MEPGAKKNGPELMSVPNQVIAAWSLLRYSLFFAPQILLAIVPGLMRRRRLQKQLPIFATYVVFELLGFFVVAVVAFHHPSSSVAYSRVTLVGNGVGSILELAVIYALGNDLIFSRFRSCRLLRNVFGGSLAVLVLIAGAAS